MSLSQKERMAKERGKIDESFKIAPIFSDGFRYVWPPIAPVSKILHLGRIDLPHEWQEPEIRQSRKGAVP